MCAASQLRPLDLLRVQGRLWWLCRALVDDLRRYANGWTTTQPRKLLEAALALPTSFTEM